MKKLAVSLVLIFVASVVFSSVVEGSMSGVRVASTEHFDIIYEEAGIETASLIHDGGEAIYSSLVEYFGTDPKIHLPVVITSRYKDLNAYYNSYPANRIVIFDTVPDLGDQSGYGQTMLDVFRHELTHAFQRNIRGELFDALAKVFGDPVSFEMLFFLYPSLSEGGAVLSESAGGYGRLNSSYSMQIVKQAKLEGLFPNWFEIAGARDSYPSGLLYYYFSAAFLEYLSITYGHEVIAAIYRDFAYPRMWPTPGDVIREHIGISLEEAWKDFYDWVEVPDDTVNASIVSSRTQNALYSSLRLSPDGSVYVYDKSSWSILRFDVDLAGCSALITLPTRVGSLGVSSDGTLLLMPFVTEESSSVRLYDVSGKSARPVHSFSSSDRDFRGGTFVVMDGTEYVLLYGNEGQNTYLDLFRSDDFTRVEGKSAWLGFDVSGADFVPFGDGLVAFILTHASHSRIALLDVSDMSVRLLDNPDDLKLYSLSIGRNGGDEVLCFSWYPADSKSPNLGRYGEVSLHDGNFSMRLSETDVLGSVYGPVRMDDTVVFSSRFFEKGKLELIAVDSLGLADDIRIGTSEMVVTQRPDTSGLMAASKRYRPGKYFGDGVLIPFYISVFGESSALIGLGGTWITMDPTETFRHRISTGFRDGNLIGSYTFTSDKILPYSVSVSAMYGTGLEKKDTSLEKGGLLLDANATVSYVIGLRHPYENITVSDKAEYLMYFASDGSFAGKPGNLVSAEYRLVLSSGMGPYEYYKYYVGAYSDMLLPGVYAGFSIPSLLWWRCDGPNITNLPFSFGADVHFKDGYDNVSITGQAGVVLYGREIQRAIRFLGLHVQRFTLNASYLVNYQTKTGSFVHQAELGAGFSFSPVIGFELTKTKMSLGTALTWDSVSRKFKVKVYFSR